MRKKDKQGKSSSLPTILVLATSLLLLLGAISCLTKFLSGDKTFLNEAAGIGLFLLSLILFSLFWSAKNQQRK